ncbi:MAG: PAS domain-containing sensor histidine kinase [Gammaproteobacteria bacterium]|nr:PAS domain-containing sensor histidine kinase [Gammaproteobacteria bacterium]
MLPDASHINRYGEAEIIASPADHLFGKVLDLSENGLFLVDSERKIILWNEWMVQASSLKREDVVGSAFVDVFPALKGRRVETVINAALDTRTASLLSRSLNKAIFPLYFSEIGGEQQRIEQSVTVKPIQSEGHDYCLVQITDVTPMVQREDVLRVLAKEAEEALQEAEEASRFKSEFTSTVSHELRTPLTSIRGSLGLIASGVMGTLKPEIGRLIAIACNNTERLLFLINDILDISKIESGKMDFVMGPVDLKVVLLQSIEANQAYGEQYEVKYHLNDVVDGTTVYADTDRLMQVLNNLLSNAAKFSPKGVEVDINVIRKDEMIRIEVRDYGSGIPEQFKSRIFEKFSQADGSDTRQVGGTGLGLNISKAIVEQMSGVIGFNVPEGQGTIFYIDICLFKET